MSATIIQFPGKKSHADIYAFSYAYPSHWTDHHQYIFDHLVHDGRTVEEATAHIENEIRDLEGARALPTERAQLLFLAGRAMLRMKKIGG